MNCGHPCRGQVGVPLHLSSPCGAGVLPDVTGAPPSEGACVASLVFAACSFLQAASSLSNSLFVGLTFPRPESKSTNVLRPVKAMGGTPSMLHCELSKAPRQSGGRNLRLSELGNQDGDWPQRDVAGGLVTGQVPVEGIWVLEGPRKALVTS